MKAVNRRTAFVLILLAAALATTLSATAFGQAYIAPNPGYPLVSPPQLGINYLTIPGYGYRVTGILGATPAARIGLEPGDVLLSINGYPLTWNGAHTTPMSQASYYGGWITLRIRDVRTGWVVTRSTNLYAGGGGGGGFFARSR